MARAHDPSPSTSHRRLRLLVLAAALLAAPAARAQLGIDLTPPADQKPAPKPPAKKASPARKAQGGSKANVPPPAAQAAPSAPAPAEPAPKAVTAPPAPPPAAAAPAARKPPREEAAVLPGLDLGKATGAAKEQLDAAKKLLDEKAWETAALAFDGILRDPSLATAHDEARYQLGKALAQLGLNHSALATFDQVLDRGPQGSRFYGSSLEWIFSVGSRLANEQPLLARIARHGASAFPPGHEDRFHFLLAKYEFERGRALFDAGRGGEARTAWAEAQRLASLVRDGATPAAAPSGDRAPAAAGDPYAKARFLDGLVRYAEGDDTGATEQFKEVVRLTNPKRARPADPALREMAFLQLARIHYQNRQNRYAIFYYGKMPWGGESWLEGLWEASYAYYRIGDYEKTLGNLLTLQSPYFKDEYFPESYVLKAIVYYENCRYPEARLVLETFSGLYEPIYDELTRITASPRPPAAYHDLLASAGKPGGLPLKIRKLAYTDQNVRLLSESIGEVERELDQGIGGRRAEFRGSALARRLQAELAEEKAAMVEEGGARARATLEYQRDSLRTLLAQALRIQIEVSRKEREALEGSLSKGSQVEVVRDLKYSHAVSDEHLYWPYEGEFWRDELGTYSYTLTRGCKDRLPRSQQAPSASR